ncbi:D-alanyl-D-alanine carboxypeptidase [Oxalobacteraceae bacterium GrIS 2.11]
MSHLALDCSSLAGIAVPRRSQSRVANLRPINKIGRAVLTVSLLALSPSLVLGQTISVMDTLGRVVEKAKAGGLQSAEIVLSERNGATADQAFGAADRVTGRRIEVGTDWLWASVTKQITAVLILQFVEDGKLSLEGTIKTYLPEFGLAHGDQISVRQLLQHVSGLANPDDTKADVNGVPGFYSEMHPDISNLSQAVGFCAGVPKSQPGEKFEYNNCDYLVLGGILEKLTGKSFDALVSERISKPLGLKSVRSSGNGMTRRAIGYTTDGKPYPPVNVANFAAAGGLIGSASDLMKFDLGLLGGKLVSSESLAMLWKGDPKLGYEALGVWSFPARLAGCGEPVRLIERRGDVAGIQVRNVIAPDQGRAIVLFTNDDSIEFGEVWQGKGLSYDMLSAAFCSSGEH